MWRARSPTRAHSSCCGRRSASRRSRSSTTTWRHGAPSRTPREVRIGDWSRVSTCETSGQSFVSLYGDGGASWHDAAWPTRARLELPVERQVIGDGGLCASDAAILDALGLSSADGVLVRP